MNLLSEPKNVPVRENGSFLSKRSASAWKNGVTEEQFPSISAEQAGSAFH
jgi:hypothetical protein